MVVCFGAHVSTSKGIPNAIKYTREVLNGDILQIFSQSPRSLKGPSDKTINDIPKIIDAIKAHNVKIVSHSPYMINLSKDISTHQHVMDCLLKDLQFINKIGGIGSVVHMGKSLKLSKEEALKNMILNIKYILSNYDGDAKLIIETSCGQGTELLANLDDIGEFYNQGINGTSFTEAEKNKIEFCIDTCHIFVAGYDMRSPKEVNSYFSKFNKIIGNNKLALIHFNDSAKKLGSNVDRHANIGEGYIGNPDLDGNIDGLKAVFKKASQLSIPMVLETPDIHPYVSNIKQDKWYV
tara:strand:+ start:396 stop:1277 length:882 start_codon:yes stop_codon:yes gene_type:complete